MYIFMYICKCNTDLYCCPHREVEVRVWGDYKSLFIIATYTFGEITIDVRNYWVVDY